MKGIDKISEYIRNLTFEDILKNCEAITIGEIKIKKGTPHARAPYGSIGVSVCMKLKHNRNFDSIEASILGRINADYFIPLELDKDIQVESLNSYVSLIGSFSIINDGGDKLAYQISRSLFISSRDKTVLSLFDKTTKETVHKKIKKEIYKVLEQKL